MERKIILIAHNLRSCHNVGSLLRTAEGLGIEMVYLSGYTPYPTSDSDERLPYLAQKLNRQIEKTSLGAEKLVKWEHRENVTSIIEELKIGGYAIVALEQDKNAINITDFKAPNSIALIVGREVEGIEPEVLKLTDSIIYIPMFGKKESFNVVQASAMALYNLRFN